MRGERRFQPKIQSPRKVASRKNAASPSMASGAPKTLPTYAEYTDQFIPNWNSCTSPVATPTTKLIRSSVPKKCVSRSQASSPVRLQIVYGDRVRGPTTADDHAAGGAGRGRRSGLARTALPHAHRPG